MPARLRGVSLVVSRTRVLRPAVLLIDDDSGEPAALQLPLSIALARCRGCKRRFRVLPADVLPHKRYGLAMVASLAAAHVEANHSLRTAAWTTHTGQTPAHSTLHAWTEGLGAHVLGRPFGSLPQAHPFQATMAVTAARWSAITTKPLQQAVVDPRRHRSEAREERLAAVANVLATARAVIATVATSNQLPLCAWRQLAIGLGVPAPFAFRTGITCTPSEHGVIRDRESPALPQPNRDSPCETRTRSPPSATSKSPSSSIPPSIPSNEGT